MCINRLKQLGHIRVSRGNLVRLNEVVEATRRWYTGKLDVTSHGDGYVIVEGRDQDIKISRRFMGTALNGDTVKGKADGLSHQKSNKPIGRIEDVVNAPEPLFVGTLSGRGQKYLI
jgi:ribonuclease R